MRIVKTDAYRVDRPPEPEPPSSPFESRICESSPGGEFLLGLIHSTVLGEPQSSSLSVGDTSGAFNATDPLATVQWNDVAGFGVAYGNVGAATAEVSANTIWRSVPWPFTVNGPSNTGGTGTIRVWDWQADALYQYDAPNGRRIAGPSYHDGRFFWIEHDAPFGNARFRSALPDLTDNVQVGFGALGGPYIDFYVLSTGHLVATEYRSNGVPLFADVLPPGTSFASPWSFNASAVHHIHRHNSPGVPLAGGGWTVVSNFTNQADYSASFIVAGSGVINEVEAWDGVPFSSQSGFLWSPQHVSFFPDGRALVYPLLDQAGFYHFLISDPFDDDNFVATRVGDCAGIPQEILVREIFPVWE